MFIYAPLETVKKTKKWVGDKIIRPYFLQESQEIWSSFLPCIVLKGYF